MKSLRHTRKRAPIEESLSYQSTMAPSLRSASASLLDLPNEFMDSVLVPLKNHDLVALASSCRILRSKTSYEFGLRFYQSIHVGVDTLGLKALTSLANTPTLAKHVREIAFATTSKGVGYPFFQDAHRDRTTGREVPKGPKPIVTAHSVANQVTSDSAILARALHKLQNLELVSMKQLTAKNTQQAPECLEDTDSTCECTFCHHTLLCKYNGRKRVLNTIVKAIEISSVGSKLFYGHELDYSGRNWIFPALASRQMVDATVAVEKRENENSVSLQHIAPKMRLLRLHQPCVSVPWPMVDGCFDLAIGTANIEILILDYPPAMEAQADVLPYWSNPRFPELLPQTLRRLEIEGLRTEVDWICHFFRLHIKTLEDVSFKECSISGLLVHLGARWDWRFSINDFRSMPVLKRLRLDRLINCVNTPYGQCDSGSTIRATWESWREVEQGLPCLATMSLFDWPDAGVKLHLNPGHASVELGAWTGTHL